MMDSIISLWILQLIILLLMDSNILPITIPITITNTITITITITIMKYTMICI